jgi:hypothetical protein
MLEKMEKEGRVEQEQEAMLYLLVVELRQDWRAARDLLAGPLGQILENSPSCYLRCISKVSTCQREVRQRKEEKVLFWHSELERTLIFGWRVRIYYVNVSLSCRDV